MKNNTVLTIAAVAIVFGVGGFFGGMKYQQSRQVTGFSFGEGQFGGGTNRQFRGMGGNAGGAGGQTGMGMRRMGGQVAGQITEADRNSITVKLPDGSSKIVLVSGTTTINRTSPGTADDLKSGETVAVFGTTNSDGSVTAVNIQLNPQFRGPGGSTGSSGAK